MLETDSSAVDVAFHNILVFLGDRHGMLRALHAITRMFEFLSRRLVAYSAEQNSS
jgi:hypothetical protein